MSLREDVPILNGDLLIWTDIPFLRCFNYRRIHKCECPVQRDQQPGNHKIAAAIHKQKLMGRGDVSTNNEVETDRPILKHITGGYSSISRTVLTPGPTGITWAQRAQLGEC